MSIPESYPDRVRRALERLIEDLAPAAPEPSALVVYGSLARGAYRDGASDVNLAVVLGRASGEVLRAIARPLRTAWRAVCVEPYLVERGEIARLADVFPIKLADIQAHHDVIAGDDPFADVTIERTDLRRRVEQELRNHLMRLRRQFVAVSHSPLDLSRALVRSTSSLDIELGALLAVAGAPAQRGERGERGERGDLEQLGAAAAARFDLDRDVLARLHALKRGDEATDVHALYLGVVRVLEQAVAAADELEVAP